MTDRQIAYAGALPQTTDLLNASKFAMLGDAFTAMATLGNSASAPSTVVAGLACTPTGPASLQVNVGPGAIFSLDATDATAYGDLGTDATQIFKMGIRPSTGTLTITPPGTTGFSQVFLVQGILSDVDGGSTVLSYYNSANPAVPLSGPANAGTSQNTTRTCVCTIALKAGVAASTGTQVNPAPDSGYTALYYITVANGQTQITAGNIVAAGAGFAPFVNTALPYVPAGVQAGGWVYAADTGAANAAIVSLAPIPTALTAGMHIRAKMLFAPTGASTLTVNTTAGNVTKSIVTSGSVAIAANAWQIGDIVDFSYDGTSWQAIGVVRAGAPVYLQASRTYFVGGTGASDSNDGLSATVTGGHGPWATLQHAMGIIAQFNLNGFNITITVANGSYAPVSLGAMAGTGNVNWVGNSASPSSCIISGVGLAKTCIAASNCGTAHNFTGFALTTSGTYVSDAMYGIHASGGGTSLTVTNMSYGACLGGHYTVDQGAVLIIVGTEQVTGGCAGSVGGNGYHANASNGGTLQTPTPITCTVTTAVTFAAPWAQGSNVGFFQILYSSLTGAGNVTGQRYNVSTNAVMSTNGGGATYYPGTVSGTTSNGGQYV